MIQRLAAVVVVAAVCDRRSLIGSAVIDRRYSTASAPLAVPVTMFPAQVGIAEIHAPGSRESFPAGRQAMRPPHNVIPVFGPNAAEIPRGCKETGSRFA